MIIITKIFFKVKLATENTPEKINHIKTIISKNITNKQPHIISYLYALN